MLAVSADVLFAGVISNGLAEACLCNYAAEKERNYPGK